VEDEFLFLVNCDKLIHERVSLFRNISDIVPSFTTMSDVATRNGYPPVTRGGLSCHHL
jgi:hypothetical protein